MIFTYNLYFASFHKNLRQLKILKHLYERIIICVYLYFIKDQKPISSMKERKKDKYLLISYFIDP